MSAALLALALLLPAADPPPHGPPEPTATVLHLRETAEKSLVPDRLRVVLRAEESGTDPRTVQAAINQHMAAALARARQVAGVAAETGDYALFQETPSGAPPRWRGSQSLILLGEGAPQMLKLAGALQSDGLVMSALAYEVSPEALRGAEEDLTAEALAALDRRAAAIADRMHLRVLRYRDLTVGNAETGVRPLPRAAMMGTALAAPVAAPGREQVQLTVSADLVLGPPRP
ncbi:MAG TPA: SIMPL domain-containing protein [Stellaceae bacterium]|nr:SIMPL domain-containing protein [Stellaceae bacterium]